jgi:hypothetical protein
MSIGLAGSCIIPNNESTGAPGANIRKYNKYNSKKIENIP